MPLTPDRLLEKRWRNEDKKAHPAGDSLCPLPDKGKNLPEKNREHGRKSDWQSASGTPAHPPAACSLRHSRPRCRTG